MALREHIAVVDVEYGRVVQISKRSRYIWLLWTPMALNGFEITAELVRDLLRDQHPDLGVNPPKRHCDASSQPIADPLIPTPVRSR
ncbi:hypothetical protein [Nocardia sp. CA-135398]|uniref:hypothetical protein n=1 Tax=Nocardia sp. CA-135398 TaxID=3239977 RepID=UPI003D989ACB